MKTKTLLARNPAIDFDRCARFCAVCENTGCATIQRITDLQRQNHGAAKYASTANTARDSIRQKQELQRQQQEHRSDLDRQQFEQCR